MAYRERAEGAPERPEKPTTALLQGDGGKMQEWDVTMIGDDTVRLRRVTEHSDEDKDVSREEYDRFNNPAARRLWNAFLSDSSPERHWARKADYEGHSSTLEDVLRKGDFGELRKRVAEFASELSFYQKLKTDVHVNNAPGELLNKLDEKGAQLKKEFMKAATEIQALYKKGDESKNVIEAFKKISKDIALRSLLLRTDATQELAYLDAKLAYENISYLLKVYQEDAPLLKWYLQLWEELDSYLKSKKGSHET